VLLCNRITPSRDNPAFVESRVRYALQQAVYDAISRFEPGEPGEPGESGESGELGELGELGEPKELTSN
jgi:hypothetical protein